LACSPIQRAFCDSVAADAPRSAERRGLDALQWFRASHEPQYAGAWMTVWRTSIVARAYFLALPRRFHEGKSKLDFRYEKGPESCDLSGPCDWLRGEDLNL